MADISTDPARFGDTDEVLILNVGGYIGESTRRELQYASDGGKRIRFAETPSHEQGL